MGYQELASNGLGHGHKEGKKWVITGIPLRAPLKPIYTTPTAERDTDDEGCSTTPRGEESRIPARLTCPPAPRKRKQTLKYHNYGGVREFFTPPDLESVFLCQVERAK